MKLRAFQVVAALLLVAALCGCDRSEAQRNASQAPGGAKLRLASPAFAQDAPIPPKFSGDGADVSPGLSWTGAPSNTAELALVVDDPDAPSAEPWVHWVIYKIPKDTQALPEGIARDDKPAVPAGSMQGKNSWGTLGYRGPAPPKGNAHHYHFKLYALDTQLSVGPGLDKNALLEQMSGHIVGQGELIGTYQH
jgi:Raf kinase inhibitor-like YbhB/YbcL family protein